MPELPEVQVICNMLRNKIGNKTIKGVIVNCRKLRVPVTDNIEKKLKNKTVHEITRRGKYLIWHLDCDQCMIMHLGMSGRLTYVDNKYKCNKHDHMKLTFDDTSSVVYNDARKFGQVIALQASEVKDFFSKSGIEPLIDDFNGDCLFELVKKRKTNVKTLIMNSQLIVGIGNIYASESLFRARISPMKLGKDLSFKECEKLACEIKNTLNEAILAGGSSIKDYAHPSGAQGMFQKNFQVYGRGKEPCKNCDEPIISIRQNGRSTFFCKNCQKETSNDNE